MYTHTHSETSENRYQKPSYQDDKAGTLLLGCWCHNGTKDHTNLNLNHKSLGLRKPEVLSCLRFCEPGSVERSLNLKSGNMALVSALIPKNPLDVCGARDISWGLHSTSRTWRRLDICESFKFFTFLSDIPKVCEHQKFPLVIKTCPSTEKLSKFPALPLGLHELNFQEWVKKKTSRLKNRGQLDFQYLHQRKF